MIDSWFPGRTIPPEMPVATCTESMDECISLFTTYKYGMVIFAVHPAIDKANTVYMY